MLAIIGKGDSYKHLNQLRQVTSVEQVFSEYGRASELARSCERAFELGIKDLYVCNIQSDSDYFEIVEQMRVMAFEYVLLPYLRLHKTLKLKDGRVLPIALILSELIPHQNFILTEHHASDFVDMTHFISHYNQARKQLALHTVYKNNIVFVANHLRDSEEASIDLACALVACPVGEYPALECGESYYHLEPEDFRMTTILFKNQLPVQLFNLNNGIESNIIIQRMLKVVDAEILNAVDYLIGTRFTRNTLFTVKSQIEPVLNLRRSHYYEHFRLIDIVIQDTDIHIDIDVYPFFAKDTIRTQIVMKGI